MKEMYYYFFDAVAYGLIFTLAYKILEHFKIDYNVIVLIVVTMIIFVVGKMGFKKLIAKKTKGVEQ